jgi:hypothetical protein
MSVTSTAEALANCASTRTWTPDLCGQFCAAMYGYGSSGYSTALVQWQSVPAGLKFPGDQEAPPGALLFWGVGQGHVAIADGTGSCFSIDISGRGTVTRVPMDRIASVWGKPYLGWTVPYFQDQQWSAQMIKGVDVSRYQAVSGWETGIDFAFTKVTEGTTYVNPTWVAQRDTARAAGLVVGYYHFARPGNMIAQADFFLGKIALQPGDVLAFDWEDAGVTSAQKDAWISYVQGKTGHRVVLYCNTDFWKNRDTSSFAGDGLWIATGGYPAGSPPIQSAWLIHQYSTAGNLDHDVAQFSSRADMFAWAGGSDVALTASELKLLTETHDAVTKITSLVDTKVHGVGYYAAKGEQSLAAVLSQSRSNGGGISELKMALGLASQKLDTVAQVLANLDLSQVPAEVAAKIESLKLVVTVTEGP